MKRRLRAWSCWGLLVPLVATMLFGAGGAASAGTAGAPLGSRGPAAGPIRSGPTTPSPRSGRPRAA
jgi:hypothetical protein